MLLCPPSFSNHLFPRLMQPFCPPDAQLGRGDVRGPDIMRPPVAARRPPPRCGRARGRDGPVWRCNPRWPCAFGLALRSRRHPLAPRQDADPGAGGARLAGRLAIEAPCVARGVGTARIRIISFMVSRDCFQINGVGRAGDYGRAGTPHLAVAVPMLRCTLRAWRMARRGAVCAGVRIKAARAVLASLSAPWPAGGASSRPAAGRACGGCAGDRRRDVRGSRARSRGVALSGRQRGPRGSRGRGLPDTNCGRWCAHSPRLAYLACTRVRSGNLPLASMMPGDLQAQNRHRSPPPRDQVVRALPPRPLECTPCTPRRSPHAPRRRCTCRGV